MEYRECKESYVKPLTWKYEMTSDFQTHWGEVLKKNRNTKPS